MLNIFGRKNPLVHMFAGQVFWMALLHIPADAPTLPSEGRLNPGPAHAGQTLSCFSSSKPKLLMYLEIPVLALKQHRKAALCREVYKASVLYKL